MQERNRIFHISEDGEIELFKPRVSPSRFEKLDKNVVFGISERLLHNYLLPRNCPRVTYYASETISEEDKAAYLHSSEFVIAIEFRWFPIIRETTLYCYEFDESSFALLDVCAGYHVSYEAVKPIGVRRIEDIFEELSLRKNLELRMLSNLWPLAHIISRSSLNFSLIRMLNATPDPRYSTEVKCQDRQPFEDQT